MQEMVEGISLDELQLAARNHGMPLEALRYDVTPIGLHYLLVHYDIPDASAEDWRLDVSGHVRSPLSLSVADLRKRPPTTFAATMECAGNGRARLIPRPVSQPWLLEAVGNAEWTGVALRDVLEEAGVRDDAVEVVFTGADRGIEGDVEQQYERSLPVDEAMRPEVLLAYAVNGQPLPPQHGFPLRLIVPGWYGMTNVKWLRSITVVSEPFQGYQQVRGYRVRLHEDDEPGEPLMRMAPRALMIPPGIPEFMTRRRTVDAGTHVIEGRAWSGGSPITAVDVSDDDGRTWSSATLSEISTSPWAWRGWSWQWDTGAPGEYVLCVRARDADGNEQPVDAPWNLGGYANNAVQRVPVTVRPTT